MGKKQLGVFKTNIDANASI